MKNKNEIDGITLVQIVRILKWLGVSSKTVDEDWLSSPQGEVAMMDKLRELNLDTSICNRIVSVTVHVDISYHGMSTTRNQALQLAILEMLGKEGE